MRFIYKEWKKICKALSESGRNSITAEEVLSQGTNKKYLVLKHDVETNPKKALKLAKIETEYNHKGSYYFQAYLLTDKNIKIIKKIQELGHEVSYHYDVMDFCAGDINKALLEFENNRKKFEEYGFLIKTVCQHGNPIVNRVGYSSNRDFFRAKEIQEKYSEIADIMVDFKQKANTEYAYISDAGMGFKVIFDPINNDIIPSSDKDIFLNGSSGVLDYIEKESNAVIVSTHPHRWTGNVFTSVLRRGMFKIIRLVAKLLCKIPFMRRFMEKHYHLAKHI